MPTGIANANLKIVWEHCKACDGEGVQKMSLLKQTLGARPVSCKECNGKGFVSKYVER